MSFQKIQKIQNGLTASIIDGCEYIIEYYSRLDEGVDPIQDIDDAIKRLSAAKKALALVDKLPSKIIKTKSGEIEAPTPTQFKNRMRVLGNLKDIAERIQTLVAKIENENQMSAASRGRSITNTLPNDDPVKLDTSSRMMGGMNRIRARGNKIRKAVNRKRND